LKEIIILIILIFSPLLSQGQDSLNNHWLFSLNFGFQAHDKRLYGFAGKDYLVASQREIFGTYQFGITLSRQLALGNKINFLTGLGLSSELATFERPFNHLYGKTSGNAVLITTNRYYHYLIQAPIKL
jgi:hypothetical protein